VIASALREQVAEEIYDLFTWTGARFTFLEAVDGAAPPDQGPLASVVLSFTQIHGGNTMNVVPGDVTLGMVWTLRSSSPFSARAGRDLNVDGANTDTA